MKISDIRKATAEAYGLKVSHLTAEGRGPTLVTEARQVAMYLAKTYTTASLRQIGAQFGGRDHKTVHHAVQKITRQMGTNAFIRRRVDTVLNHLQRELSASQAEAAAA